MALPRNFQTDELFRSVLMLKDVEECYRFFEDLCTVNEVRSIAQRLDVARKLDEGESYQSTCTQTGASSATVCRVKRCLEYGAGGYSLIIERMKEQDNK